MLVVENIILILSVILIIVGLLKKSSPIVIIIVAVLLCSLQFILGSPRWQFIPIYIFVALVSFATLMSIRQIWVRRTLISLGILCLLISQVTNYVLPVFTLPATNGDYNISTIANTLENNLSYKLWFPIGVLPEADRKKNYYSTDLGDQSIMGMPKFLFSHLKRVKTNALEKGQIANQKFPLIIYSHGASSIMVDNTALMEEIASHGYIVVAIQHNFSFEKYGIDINDAKKEDAIIQQRLIDSLLKNTVPVQVNDLKNLISSLQKLPYANHIDFSNIGLIGHSLGGSTVTSAPAIMHHVNAVINIDGPIKESDIKQYEPSFLYISSFSPDLTDEELKEFRVTPEFYRMVKNYELQNVKKYFEVNESNSSWVRFKTANHLDLTDMPFAMPLLTSKNYNKREGHDLKSKIVVAFVNQYLKNKSHLKYLENKSIEWIKR